MTIGRGFTHATFVSCLLASLVVPSFMAWAEGKAALTASNRHPDEFTGAETVLVGGKRVASGDRQTARDAVENASLDVVSAPYGPFNAGCALCVFTSQSDIADNRAGISGLDYRMGAKALSGQDIVGFYEAPSTLEARMILDVASYGPRSVTLQTPMTPAQMARLHTNMYIVTNSVDPRFGLRPLPMYDDNAIKLVNLMSGIVSGWSTDGRVINVAAWAVPSGNDFSEGQIPDARRLDVYWSQYRKPVVFVGAGTKMFARNTWMYYDGSKTKGLATSLIRAMETEEVDLRYTASRMHEVEMRGITISMDPLGGVGPKGLTSDSYHLLLSGYSPTMLMFNDGKDTNIIKAHAFYVHGNEGVGPERPAGELFEHSAYADGISNMRLTGYLTRTGAPVGANAAAMHLGLRIDGQQGDPTSGGSWGEIVWNKDAKQHGGLALCGGSGRCGFGENWDGSIVLGAAGGKVEIAPGAEIRLNTASSSPAEISAEPEGDVVAGAKGGGLRTAVLNLRSLPRKRSIGTQMYCADCRAVKSRHLGLPVWWNGHEWTDAMGGGLNN